MKVKDITSAIEEFAPLAYQESYDNAGLIVGNGNQEVSSALICIDITEEVIKEAIQKNIKLIISHHPIVFSGLKRINGKNYVERIIIEAIKNDIAIYSGHTNIDSVYNGVNMKICEKIGLENCKILDPVNEQLKKLVTFVPVEHIEKVRNAVFEAGAGKIGEYDNCSYNIEGTGTFRGSDNTDPFVGEKGKLHKEKEIRFETIFPKVIMSKVINALLNSHPYEEVPYDIYPLENLFEKIGMGMTGKLKEPVSTIDFLKKLKEIFNIPVIKHSEIIKDKVNKVAVCGGNGSFLIKKAISSGADIFITGDLKYHQFFDADKRIILADIGHFESEQFTMEIFYDILTKKFPKFAVYFTEVNTNSINYI